MLSLDSILRSRLSHRDNSWVEAVWAQANRAIGTESRFILPTDGRSFLDRNNRYQYLVPLGQAASQQGLRISLLRDYKSR